MYSQNCQFFIQYCKTPDVSLKHLRLEHTLHKAKIFMQISVQIEETERANELMRLRIQPLIFFPHVSTSNKGLMLETSAKTTNPTGENTISTFVDQTHIQRTRQCRKTFFFKTSLPMLDVCLTALQNEILKKSHCTYM